MSYRVPTAGTACITQGRIETAASTTQDRKAILASTWLDKMYWSKVGRCKTLESTDMSGTSRDDLYSKTVTDMQTTRREALELTTLISLGTYSIFRTTDKQVPKSQ